MHAHRSDISHTSQYVHIQGYAASFCEDLHCADIAGDVDVPEILRHHTLSSKLLQLRPIAARHMSCSCGGSVGKVGLPVLASQQFAVLLHYQVATVVSRSRGGPGHQEAAGEETSEHSQLCPHTVS